jgi:type VI secretion system protein ImpL
VWWILAALLSLIAWALWYIVGLYVPDLGIWIPITATGVLLALSIVLFVWRRVRARRAAAALEQAIARQGAQQALSARPERRAEIQALQQQIQGGIAALKRSKLGSGKKGGAAALYSLPWYVIIGPPGAGKTTALKHSGLVFPFAEAGGGAVRGVGGTRNCDWWFTNEAILLDTAGRFSTEADDHDEWMAFLQMLLKYRSRQPINGVLVAVSITDLIDANEQQIDALAKKLRARVDEVMTQLHMVMPVYLLFTKCDLVAGFTEFFGDLLKGDRQAAWGTTLRLDQPKLDPAKLFEAEFDTLTMRVHARALKRLTTERMREARERIIQFPLEFAGVRRNLADLIGTLFMVNAFQGTPIFRGFYFTSGTQEGRPVDRVLARMGAAMGIRTSGPVAQQAVEPKSYFLFDVFTKIVFPDGTLAARSKSEIRRQLLMRVAVSAAAFSLAIIVAIPSVVSFLKNKTFLGETRDRVQAASAIAWFDGQPPSPKLKAIGPVLERLKQMDTFRSDGPPFDMSFMMYEGERVYRPTVMVYVSLLQQGFAAPVKQKLEAELKNATGKSYLRERTALKTYLMLSDVEHLDVDWETGRLTGIWSQILRPTSDLPEFELKQQLQGHVRYYLELLKEKKVKPLPLDTALVDKVKKTLRDVPVPTKYYDFFVNSIIEEKNDESGDLMRDNLRFPPVTLDDVLVNHRDAQKFIGSQLYQKEKRWKEIEGPYTDKGRRAVLLNLENAEALLLSEEWVVPLGPDESVDKIPSHIANLRVDYETRYVNSWNDWLADITVRPPASLNEAAELYKLLTATEWAYLRIVRVVEDNTQWKTEASALENKALTDRLNKRINQELSMRTGGLKFNVDMRRYADRPSSPPHAFRSLLAFGIVPAAKEGTVQASQTGLMRYMDVLEKLRGQILDMQRTRPDIDARVLNVNFQDAAKQVETFVAPHDDRTKTLLAPILMNPLRVAGTRYPAVFGGKFR